MSFAPSKSAMVLATFIILSYALALKWNCSIAIFNNFAEVYHTKGNMALLADSFQRKLIMSDFKKWLVVNLGSFLFT